MPLSYKNIKRVFSPLLIVLKILFGGNMCHLDLFWRCYVSIWYFVNMD